MRIKNRLKFIVLATLVGLISGLFYNAVPQKVEAKTMYTNLYAQSGRDTTPIPGFGHNLTSSELYSLKFLDSNQYKIKGKWNKYITDLDKLELKNFFPKISTTATIEGVYLHGIWSKNDKEMNDAWITVYKPTTGEKYVKHLPIPAPGVNSHILINLTSFLPTANDINNAFIRFQAKSKHFLPCKRAVTWHEQFKLAVKYDDHLADPQVTDGDSSIDIDWIKPNQDGTLTISANWSGFGEDVDFYKVCAGTALNETHTACHEDYPNNGTQNIVSQTPTPFTSGSVNIPSPPNNTKYYVYVKAFYEDRSTFALAHSDGVTVDSEGPIVNITSPISGSTLNKNIQILADADDNAGVGIEKVGFAYLNDMDEYVDKDGNLIDPVNPFFAVDSNGSDGWSASIDSTQNNDGTYNIAAVGFDYLGNIAMDKIVISIDNTPPDNPNVIGTPGDGEATLSWNAVADAIYYNIFRDGSPIATHYTDLSFKDSGLTNSVTYQYRITAVDALLNESSGTTIKITPISETLGEILATATFRPTGAVAGVAVEPEEEGLSTIVEPGKVLAQEKTKDSPKTKNKAPYWGWLYLLIIFMMILVGYYYYYLKDEYSQWYWVFPAIVAILLWFINRSLTRVFDGGLAAQLFWLWELIILALFAIFYNFWGVPKIEKIVTKKFRKK